MTECNFNSKNLQESEDGIYKSIGDGLRKNPRNLMTHPESTAVEKLVDENCAHINVFTKTIFYKRFKLHVDQRLFKLLNRPNHLTN